MHHKRIIIAGPAHPLRGGLAAFNERFARQLQKEGHEVIIYTFSLQYPSFLFPGKTQYSDEPAPVDLDIRVKINSINPFNWISTASEIKKQNADILILRFWIPFIGPSLGTIARLVKRNRKTKIIGFLDNVLPHEKRAGDRFLTSWFLKSCNGFLLMSKQVLNELQLFVKSPVYCLSPHPLYDYGNLVPMEEARRHLQLGSQPLLLFFGFIRGYKGLDLLLKSMPLIIKQIPDIRLVVAGEFYESEAPYMQLVKELNISENVIFHKDYIPDNEVKYYFGAADLVVQPYKSATQSGISQLAYHFEKPMVVTNVGGLPEIVPHGEAGIVTEPQPDAIANAVTRYFKEDLKGTFEAGVRKNKSRFTWERFTEETEALFNRL